MKFGKIVLYGFLIWVILFFIGWFLLTVLPENMHLIMLILSIILIYLFSRPIIDERYILAVGVTWLSISFILDLIFLVWILGNEAYYSQWSIFGYYILLLLEPSIVKALSKK